MVPAHALSPRASALAAAALLATLATGCPTPMRSDGGMDARPPGSSDPTLEIVGRPGGDCTELRFVVAVRVNGQLVPLTSDALTFGVTPVFDAGGFGADVGDAAAPAMEQPVMNSCFGVTDAGAGGYTVCLRGLTMGQTYFVLVRAPYDGGRLQLSTLLTAACRPNDGGGDAEMDATDAQPPVDAPVDTEPPTDATDAAPPPDTASDAAADAPLLDVPVDVPLGDLGVPDLGRD